MLDTHVFSINLENGTESNVLPGLIALTPPRHVARGRENDVLVVLASFGHNNKISPNTLNLWLAKKAADYHQTPGTATFAIKKLVETLNKDLLERNLKRAGKGERLNASLSVAVIRRENLYMVNIGTSRAWFAGADEARELSEGSEAKHGLGVDEKLTFRYATRTLSGNEVLAFSCYPPAIWNESTLSGAAGLSSEMVGRRLFNQVGNDLQAVMLRFVTGKGEVFRSVLYNRPPSSLASEKPAPATGPNLEISPDLGGLGVPDEASEKKIESAEYPAQENTVIEKAPANTQSDVEPLHAKIVPPTQAPPPIKPPSETQVKAGTIVKDLVEKVHEVKSSASNFLKKIAPELADEPLKFSRSALIGIAISVPMIISLAAGCVYIKTGRNSQFNQNLILAQQYAMEAEVQAANTPLRLANLQQSLYWLEKAATYGRSDTSVELHNKVQTDLDALQGVQRIDMIEVTPGGLPAGTVVSQIVATSTDLYLLDARSGSVQRYSMGSAGYEKDEVFECGPNSKNPLNFMGKIVDIAPLNINNTFKATLLAVDASGRIEYCIPGDAGVSGMLVAPDQGWVQLTAITLSGTDLYILDAGGKAVYFYEGNGFQFDDKPTLFFDTQIPDLSQAVDIVVNGDELYVLRSNGQMVECTYSYMKSYKLTECQDPAFYGDMRTGQVPAPVNFPDAQFIQMRLTAAPDSSIYILDAAGKSLYHFSLQRNLQKILYPRFADGTILERLSPTAVAVSTDRLVFMAFGSQIYYGPLP